MKQTSKLDVTEKQSHCTMLDENPCSSNLLSPNLVFKEINILVTFL